MAVEQDEGAERRFGGFGLFEMAMAWLQTDGFIYPNFYTKNIFGISLIRTYNIKSGLGLRYLTLMFARLFVYIN